MNLTRLLGVLTVTVGGSLLLIEPFIGQDVMMELTGNSRTTLRLICTVALIVGVVGIGLGKREEKESTYNKGGQES